MDNRDCLILKTLAQKKSITQAAEVLYISQPALTARIKHIEQEFATQLIFRTSKGIYFTPQGEVVLQSAINWLKSYEDVKEKLLNLSDKIQGTLRIAASGAFSKYRLPQLLRLFKQTYPDIEFEVYTLWSDDILGKLHALEAHVGFVRFEHGWQEGCEELYQEPLQVISTFPLVLQDLPSIPRITYQTGTTNQLLIDQWWREHYCVPSRDCIKVDKADTCREMVLQGLGYAILPATVMDGSSTLHRHDMLSKQGKPVIRKTWMIYKHQATGLRTVDTFLRFVRQLDICKL